MSRSRTTFAILTVVLLVATLGAITAQSASAVWFVEGSELASSATLATTAKVTENFTFKILAANFNIECTDSTLDSKTPEIKAPDSLLAASLTFNECGASGENCTLATKTITTVPLLAELTEPRYPEDKVVFLPKTKTTFATIKFSGATCALLGVQPITGRVTASLPTGQEEKPLQLIKAKTTKGDLKIGSDETDLTGTAEIKLESGLKFSEIPLLQWFVIKGGEQVSKVELKFLAAGEEVELSIENVGNSPTTIEAVEIKPNENNFGKKAPPENECKMNVVVKPGPANACFLLLKSKGKKEKATLKIVYGIAKDIEIELKE